MASNGGASAQTGAKPDADTRPAAEAQQGIAKSASPQKGASQQKKKKAAVSNPSGTAIAASALGPVSSNSAPRPPSRNRNENMSGPANWQLNIQKTLATYYDGLTLEQALDYSRDPAADLRILRAYSVPLQTKVHQLSLEFYPHITFIVAFQEHFESLIQQQRGDEKQLELPTSQSNSRLASTNPNLQQPLSPKRVRLDTGAPAQSGPTTLLSIQPNLNVALASGGAPSQQAPMAARVPTQQRGGYVQPASQGNQMHRASLSRPPIPTLPSLPALPLLNAGGPVVAPTPVSTMPALSAPMHAPMALPPVPMPNNPMPPPPLPPAPMPTVPMPLPPPMTSAQAGGHYTGFTHHTGALLPQHAPTSTIPGIPAPTDASQQAMIAQYHQQSMTHQAAPGVAALIAAQQPFEFKKLLHLVAPNCPSAAGMKVEKLFEVGHREAAKLTQSLFFELISLGTAEWAARAIGVVRNEVGANPQADHSVAITRVAGLTGFARDLVKLAFSYEPTSIMTYADRAVEWVYGFGGVGRGFDALPQNLAVHNLRPLRVVARYQGPVKAESGRKPRSRGFYGSCFDYNDNKCPDKPARGAEMQKGLLAYLLSVWGCRA